MTDERLAKTLIINRFDSKCGACGKGADPRADTHDQTLGYGEQGAGCGVRWEYVTSDYGSSVVKAAAEMRPDLEPWDRWEEGGFNREQSSTSSV